MSELKKPLLTIREEWASYADRVLPRDAHPIQKIETRRAFYAGAWSVLMGFTRTIGADSVSVEEGVATMEAIKAEIEEFYQSVRDGEPGQ